MGEKISGKIESMMGKVTKDPSKVQEGELKASGQLPAGHSSSTTTGYGSTTGHGSTTGTTGSTY